MLSKKAVLDMDSVCCFVARNLNENCYETEGLSGSRLPITIILIIFFHSLFIGRLDLVGGELKERHAVLL